YVDVPAPAWSNELSVAKLMIVDALVKETGISITDIKFRVYSFNIKEKENLDLKELTDEEIDYINSLLADLKYEELKRPIFNIIGYHLLRKKKK
ncbi:MAG: hypothetical protein ACP5JL_07235, partial [bacterium]